MSSTVQPPVNAGGPQVPPPVDPNQPGQPARVYGRTHRDEDTANFLAAQDLRIKLDLNKEIELANHARTMQTIRHRTDPAQYPAPGSPAASFISIPDDDLNDLRIPAVYQAHLDVMPTYIKDRLARDRAAEAARQAAAAKRPVDDNEDDTSSFKRRRARGSDFFVHDPLNRDQIVFPSQLLFTDSVSTLPLPFFEDSVLRKIISKASSIPSKKHTALNGKTVHIWDLKWMKTEFKIKEELELTHSEFCQASDNYYRFQATKAEDPLYTERYRVHFTFYRNLVDSAATYDGWKSAELETRSNAAELNHAYSETQYTNATNKARESPFRKIRTRDSSRKSFPDG
ncbi:hypothetical protein D9613_007896 [Agrocybe pediades]|uniref:Uncharacterized protein n=1 Tax=Agrocybe pediades TaxID=84607 RepID=A0A8H4VMJ7_9AGAR|nr:hypothetical protein D9613_007896 [Agrocybe pediades]